MKLQKLVSCLLAVSTLFAVTACNGVNEEEMKALAPDYSKYTHKFDAYCYSGPNDGYWNQDGVVYYTGKDLRTVEHYKDYKDAGMTIYFPQNDARMSVCYGAEVKYEDWVSNFWDLRQADWEQNAKEYWDRAYEAGLEKIIMYDPQFTFWSNVRFGMLVRPADAPATPEGEESPYTFESEAEFDEVVAKLLEPYVDHPAFYGVMLRDEPEYAVVESYGQVYRAIKRVAENVYHKDIFVQHNLIPMRATITSGVYTMMPLLEWFDDEEDSISIEDYYTMVGGSAPNQEVTNPAAEVRRILEEELTAYGGDAGTVARLKYEKYLEQFVLSMGSDYVQYDDYPMNGTEDAPEILYSYMLTLQAASNVSKRLNIDLQVVSQSFGSTRANGVGARILSEDECHWMNNMLLAFGVSQINYYTYIAKKTNTAADHYYSNYGSFITRTGEKTDIYYYYQKINQQNNKFAPVKLNFKYQGSRVYAKLPLEFPSEYLSSQWIDNSYVFSQLKDFSVNKEAALVTESYDSENNRYMYCVQNITDPAYKGSITFQTTVLTFDSAKYKYVAIYRNGERTLQALENGKLTIKNAAGEAAFVIPY